ncbi:unnamed protein product, partial [Ectocarpus sp. 8 AP-2014]
GALQAQDGNQKTLNVYFDLGPQAFRDADILNHVSAKLVHEVKRLRLALGDEVRIASIGGSYAERLSAPDFNRSFKFTFRGADPRDLPRGMAEQIALLPQQKVQSSQGGLQALIGEIETDCEAGPVHTIIVMNGTDSLTLNGNDAEYVDLPQVRLCGTFTFVGWWTFEHPEAWPGMRKQVEAFTKDLMIGMGASDVDFIR